VEGKNRALDGPQGGEDKVTNTAKNHGKAKQPVVTVSPSQLRREVALKSKR